MHRYNNNNNIYKIVRTTFTLTLHTVHRFYDRVRSCNKWLYNCHQIQLEQMFWVYIFPSVFKENYLIYASVRRGLVIYDLNHVLLYLKNLQTN